MHTEELEFRGPGGRAVGALWHKPTQARPTDAARVIVHCPGWSGTAGSRRYADWHRFLTDAGMSVIAFDFPGRGASVGSLALMDMAGHLNVLQAAIRLSVDVLGESMRGGVGLLGSGATGGSLVLEAAAESPTVDAVVAQFPIATGRSWLNHLLSSEQRSALERVIVEEWQLSRSGEEPRWLDFDAIRHGAKLEPQAADPQRAGLVPVSLVESLLAYWPVDHAERISCPVLLLSVEDDRIVPESGARSWVERLAGPRRLVMQRHVEHYESYERGAARLRTEMTTWFGKYVGRTSAAVSYGEVM